LKKNITISYFARVVSGKSPGVDKKIRQTVEAFIKLGYSADFQTFDSHGLKNVLSFCTAVFKSKSHIIIIRNSAILPLIFPFLIFKRLVGTLIIIDVPTPNCTVVDEIELRKLGFFNKMLRIILHYISFPWSLIPANLILQYAKESRYFSFLIRKKIKLISNGMDVDSVKMRKKTSRTTNQISLIAVASLSLWHGFDRVIDSIYDFKFRNHDSISIKFIIVGGGEGFLEYSHMIKKLNLQNEIKLEGYKDFEELDNLFDKADIAVSTLGLYRKKLNMASSLKSREYTSRGIPFIMAGYDLDFDPIPEFVFSVSNTDEKIDFQKILNWFESISQNENLGKDMRNYAKKYLDFEVKLIEILNDKRVIRIK
jgi:hypothetical protein